MDLESLAQDCSEHCKHTNLFASPMDDDVPDGLVKRISRQPPMPSGSLQKGDNRHMRDRVSGSIIFDDHYLVTHKVETHNSPSAR